MIKYWMKQEDYPEEILALLKFGARLRPGPSDLHSNSTLPMDLLEIFHPPTDCEDCGLTVTNRQINIRKITQPVAHWRKECSICKQCEHPITKDFSLTSTELRDLIKSLHTPDNTNKSRKNKDIDK